MDFYRMGAKFSSRISLFSREQSVAMKGFLKFSPGWVFIRFCVVFKKIVFSLSNAC